MIKTTIDDIVKAMKETDWVWATPMGGTKVPDKEEFIKQLSLLIKRMLSTGSGGIAAGGLKVTRESYAKGIAYFNEICEFNIPKDIATTIQDSAVEYAKQIVNLYHFRHTGTKRMVQNFIKRAFIAGADWQSKNGTK